MTAFSLVFSFPLFADEPLEFEDEIASSDEPSRKNDHIAFPQKNSDTSASGQKTDESAPKKIKAHFAGAKRPEEPAVPKKSRKIKNEWFFSKTQPKGDKKVAAAPKEKEVNEIPSDRPFYISSDGMHASDFATFASSTIADNNRSAQGSNGTGSQEMTEGQEYPMTGFAAPRGHVFLTGEWLYWRTRQEGMEFATSREIHFDFQSGFRVGIGTHLPDFDGWTIDTNYTNFRPKGSKSVHHSAYPLFLFRGGEFGPCNVTDAHGRWKIDFQNLDVEFGKSYYLTKTLVFSPFFGFKGAWIDQHAKFRYEGGFVPEGESFRTRFKNDFKGAGPLIGTEMNWQLGMGFSFFGDIAASVLAGHFENKQTQHQIDDVETVHFENNFNLVSPMLQMAAGAAWDRNFHEDKCHFGLSLGFETQYWWSQNQTEQFTSTACPIYVRQNGDLAFYGLTLRARLDF